MQFNFSNFIDAISIGLSLTGMFLNRKNKEMKQETDRNQRMRDIDRNSFGIVISEVIGFSVDREFQGYSTYKILLTHGHEIQNLSLETVEEILKIANGAK